MTTETSASDTRDGRRDYFDALYTRDPDPWRYENGPYEIAKRADTLDFLRAHYASACEVGWPNVEIRVRHLPHEELEGEFDLLVLSEMLYFLNESELAALAEMAARRVAPGGDVLIVSFDGATQTRLDGPASTAAFLAAALPAFDVVRAQQREHYHIRLLRRS